MIQNKVRDITNISVETQKHNKICIAGEYRDFQIRVSINETKICSSLISPPKYDLNKSKDFGFF